MARGSLAVASTVKADRHRRAKQVGRVLILKIFSIFRYNQSRNEINDYGWGKYDSQHHRTDTHKCRVDVEIVGNGAAYAT